MTDTPGRRRADRRVLVGLLLAVLITLACGVSPGQDEAEEPAPRPSSGSSDQQDGTQTPEEFERDIQVAVELAERYWSEQFKASGERFQPIRRIGTYERDGEVTCGGQGIPRNNAVYCSDGDFIAYDLNWAFGAFRKIGDAFLYYLLGHEYAHGVQVRLGIRYDYTIQQELQADCMAGAYLGDLIRAKALGIAEGDLEEFRRGLLAVGDDPGQPWFAEGAHGTAEQRTEAFFAGYKRSLDACDLG